MQGRSPGTRRTRGHRLSPHVRPQDVDLHVELDPERRRSFRGRVSILLRLDRASRRIELHADHLRVTRPRLVADGRTLRPRITPRPERQTLELELPEQLPAGEARLELRFAGRLRDDLRGLYLARSGGRRYAFTQLEATEARSFFPCFDEPAFKARFRLSVTTAASHTVLSNSPAQRLERLPDGRKTVHFARTPLLSTYLLALAVGALEGSRVVRCGRTPIRVWHVPGKRALTGFALEAGRQCLRRLERYFDLPYPYAKLDLVAVPDFEAGAMENAGAVFFRETLLLLDPRTVTRFEQKRVAEVVCHELAHMWYGDLVTMSWWNDLWLNEAFATWMAFHVVDDWKPGWRMWNDFQHFRAAALELDALENTHPIYAEVSSPDEATENFDLITYEKGASVVRMIEHYLGSRTFRTGVRRYIRRHREANTVAADLWRALEEASGREVAPVVRAWIERDGFPLLAVRRRRAGAGVRAVLSQERFHGAPPRSARERERRARSREWWPIPWVARLGTPGRRRTRLVRELVTGRRAEVALGRGEPRFLYANADEGGFFRPCHEPPELGRLAGHVDQLAPVERMGMLAHQWALVRADRAGLGSYLDLVTRFGDERDPDVLAGLAAPLGFLERQVAPATGAEARSSLRRRWVEVFGPALARLGPNARRGDSDDTRLRRAALVAILGSVAEWEPVLEDAARLARAYLQRRGALDPNLADACVALAARRGDARLFRAFVAGMERATTPQERRRFLMGLGEFSEPALVERALALTLGERVATQDVALLLARMLANPAAGERTWTFLTGSWAKLRRRMPPALVTRVIDATPALQSARHRRAVAAFFRAHPVPTGQRAVRQALERFDRNAELRRRAAPALRAWLAQPSERAQPAT